MTKRLLSLPLLLVLSYGMKKPLNQKEIAHIASNCSKIGLVALESLRQKESSRLTTTAISAAVKVFELLGSRAMVVQDSKDQFEVEMEVEKICEDLLVAEDELYDLEKVLPRSYMPNEIIRNISRELASSRRFLDCG